MSSGPATSSARDSGLLADRVHATLRERILRRSLPPGAALRVPALATDLAVSRSPVREAVLRLIGEGLAVHVPHAGARVVELDDAAVLDTLRVRQVLDALAAREAATRAGTRDVERLAAIVAAQEALAGEGADGDDALARREAALDVEFHAVVRDLAGNAALTAALTRLETVTHLFDTRLWASPHHRGLALREHRTVLAAIDAGDAAAAEAAAGAHVAALLVRLRRWRAEDAGPAG